MKIKITEELPVAENVRPEVGSVHEVIGKQEDGPEYGLLFIRMGDAQIGVAFHECEIVKEEA